MSHRIFQVLALTAQTVSVWPGALHTRAHGHRHRNPLVKQPCCKRGFAQTRTPRHTGFLRVDLWDFELDAVEDAVESPGPCGEDTWDQVSV